MAAKPDRKPAAATRTAAKRTPAKRTPAKRTPAKRTPAGKGNGFSAAEREAMRERAAEVRGAARRRDRRAEGEADVAARIAALAEPDRTLVARLDALIRAAVPELEPRTWYGMPAYARDGAVVCFVQAAQKFGTRYTTLGFSDRAHLDDGTMWPTAFAVARLDPATERRIRALVVAAAG